MRQLLVSIVTLSAGCAAVGVEAPHFDDTDATPGDADAGGRETSDNLPDTPPTVKITSPVDGSAVDAGTLRIEGVASDERAVNAVFVKVGPNVARRADTRDNFKHFWIESAVPQGMFTISAEAHDSAAQASTPDVVHVMAPITSSDDAAPTIAITSPPDKSTPAQTLALVMGTANDDRGVVAIDVLRDGDLLEERAVETDDFFATWSRLVPLIAGQDNVLTFIARDASGHETRTTLSLYGRSEIDREAPTLAITAPLDGASLSTASLEVSGTATDNIGVREVKLRVGHLPEGSSTRVWSDYVVANTNDGFANWRWPGLQIPIGAFDLEVKAIDLSGLATTVAFKLVNEYVPVWSDEVALPLRLREEGAKPVLKLQLDRQGVNDVIAADIQRNIKLLDLDTTTLLTNSLTQIKNSCGTAWQNDNPNPNHNCASAYGANWQTSPEYSFVRILTMTPANVVVDGTSIQNLKNLADTLNVGGGFRQILAETLGIPRTQEIVGTAALVYSLQNFWMKGHPAVLPGAKLPITLYDAMNDLHPLRDTLGPAAGHPGIIDPSFPIESQVFGPNFQMLLEALSNLRWKDGVDVSDAEMKPAKDYIALVVDDIGPTFNDVLEFNFTDPAKFNVTDLTANPTVDLRMRLVEDPIFVPACTAGAATCLSNRPETPVASYIWSKPSYEAETVIAGGALQQYRNRDNYSKTYPALLVGSATVTVGAGTDPAGWSTFTTTFNFGNPPPPQYLWELILEVAQVALHNYSGMTLPEGSANAAFTLRTVPVGLTADQIRAAIRPELQKQSQKLSDELLGDYKQNNGPVDFYYDRGADGKPYVFFVAASDPLPQGAYRYPTPGFFADAELKTKLSTTAAGTSGDSVHEKLSLSLGETTVYMADQTGSVHRLRFVVGADPTEIRVFVSARAL